MNKNQPAFPGTQYANGVQPSGWNEGMTLRDYFAAKAIDHLLEHCSTYESAAIESYKMADAMLKAREQ